MSYIVPGEHSSITSIPSRRLLFPRGYCMIGPYMDISMSKRRVLSLIHSSPSLWGLTNRGVYRCLSRSSSIHG